MALMCSAMFSFVNDFFFGVAQLDNKKEFLNHPDLMCSALAINDLAGHHYHDSENRAHWSPHTHRISKIGDPPRGTFMIKW